MCEKKNVKLAPRKARIYLKSYSRTKVDSEEKLKKKQTRVIKNKKKSGEKKEKCKQVKAGWHDYDFIDNKILNNKNNNLN